jgi:acyl carrier protein
MAEVDIASQHSIEDTIRNILREFGRLAVDASALNDDSNLYDAGLTSHGSVNLMLAIEERFDVEFPDRLMQRGSFATIAAIRTNVQYLIGERG